MSVVSRPWGPEPVRVRFSDITPCSLPSSLPVLGKTGFLLRGQSHLLAARPKVGKTVLMLKSIEGWLTELTDTCPQVLWISEEGMETWGFRRSEYRADLPVEIVHSNDVSDWLGYCCTSKDEVVIVDTASAVMGIENENLTECVQPILSAWVDLFNTQSRTLIIIHHHRKSEGDSGSRISGSSAWTRIPTMILELSLQNSLRHLSVTGRFPCPDSILYDSEFQVVESGPSRKKGVTVCISCGEEFKPLWPKHDQCHSCWAQGWTGD
jgi:hypothetical protein